MNVRLQPTTECLVHLTDPPFLVVTLADIEIASLERVQYSLKQFDLVLVFKDFTKPPLHINSIQSSQLDDVKNWLEYISRLFRHWILEWQFIFFSVQWIFPWAKGQSILTGGPSWRPSTKVPMTFSNKVDGASSEVPAPETRYSPAQ